MVSDSVATLDAFMGSPQQQVMDAEGTEVNLSSIASMNTSAATFFGYVRGLPTTDILGPLTPLVAVVLFSFAVSWFLAAIRFALPLIGAVIGLILRVVRFILDVLRTLGSYIPFT